MIVTVNIKFNGWGHCQNVFDAGGTMNNKNSSTITKRAQNIAHKTGVIS